MAMDTRFRVVPEVIEWVKDNTDFEGLSEDWQKRILRWQNEGERPTLEEILTVSRLLYVPKNYFFLEEAPKEDVPMLPLRTIIKPYHRRLSRNLVETMLDMEGLQSDLSRQREKRGLSFCEFVGGGTGCHDQPKVIANAILDRLGIRDKWATVHGSVPRYSLLQEGLRKARVMVMTSETVGDNEQRELDPAEFRSFLMLDDFAPLIFVNGNDSWNQMLFALVHEVAHMWQGTSELFDGTNDLDQQFRSPELEKQNFAVTFAMLGETA